MPKKNSIINNIPEQEKVLIEDNIPFEEQQPEEPKKRISDKQSEHLKIFV